MLFFLVVLCARACWAQQTPAAGVDDVTERVRPLVRDNSLEIVSGTALAGYGPARKIVKKVVVIYSAAGVDTVASEPPGSNLVLKKGLYGDIPDLNMNALLATPFPTPTAAGAPTCPQQKATISLPRPQLLTTPTKPVMLKKRGEIYFVDFGKDAFGNLQITFPKPPAAGTVIKVRMGEKLSSINAIDRKPPGSVSYVETTFTTEEGKSVYKPDVPLKPGYQSQGNAVKTPPEIGNITPFRYAEIEGSPVSLDEEAFRHVFVHSAFDDTASSFQSSDETLNAVWELCKHTMKATTAFGVYIDGERERRPYEADAYINQLSHWAVDANPEVARYSLEYLLAHPTWPTEWSLLMPMMAAFDYEATGSTGLAGRNWEILKGKLLMSKAREDGLLRSSGIVDWPQAERDGYNEGKGAPDQGQQVGPMINTVVNAFYYHALQRMAALARALQKEDDASLFDEKAKQVYESFNAKFFDAARGVYMDGEDSRHASLHANMFPLAFDLTPVDRQQKVADFVQSRGMACSVYGAQFLLEALYKAGRDDYALQLMTLRDQRSWWNMLQLGSTMTLEAWDFKFKPNSTWNHPWGAAPANIISRYLLGVRPLSPGYEKVLIAPQPGRLKSAEATVPTPRGPVMVSFKNEERFVLEIELPPGVSATISLRKGTQGSRVLMDKQNVTGASQGNRLLIENVTRGRHFFEVQ